MDTFQDFELSLLLMGWRSMDHDGVGIKQKWENNGSVLTKRKYVNPTYIIYNSGRRILGMMASSVEFNNIHEVMDYLEKRDDN